MKFALWHIGWPWVDECLAVAGHSPAVTQGSDWEMQMFIDIIPGILRSIQIPRGPWLHASFRDVCSGTPISTNEWKE